MDNLKDAIVIAIDDNTKAMSVEEAQQHIEELGNWKLMYEDSKGYHLIRYFGFVDADKSREFIHEIKTLCEDQHGIPDIQINGTEVSMVCYTPRLCGLHMNDFIVAAYAEDLYLRWDAVTAERDKVTQASYDSFPASDPPGY